MKKLFFILLFSVSLIAPLEAQWCGRPCLRDRYYNSWWVNDNSWYYGYFDINEYPYTLPVNCYFNPRPCRIQPCYRPSYSPPRAVEQPLEICPYCNRRH